MFMLSLIEELSMNYDQYVSYLLKKYGPAQYDYFCNESCKTKNSKVSRTKEDLFCHHIDENKEVLLSTPEIAKLHAFKYQKKDRLVYCNILEHLLLHIKIVQEFYTDDNSLGIGGVGMITDQINCYYQCPPTAGWQFYTYCPIKDRYDDYIHLLAYMFLNIYPFKQMKIEEFCTDSNGKIIKQIYQDVNAQMRINASKNNRIYIGDKVSEQKFGSGTVIALLMPEGYDEPVIIIENQKGNRLAVNISDIRILSIEDKIKRDIVLYPGDSITDEKYGSGYVKDIAVRESDTIITVLYKEYFCVYLNNINSTCLIENKKIIPKNKLC
jgi:hypothetical protein